MGQWIELRDECDRLYARVDLETALVEVRVNGRTRLFDLATTLRERRAVLVRVRDYTTAGVPSGPLINGERQALTG